MTDDPDWLSLAPAEECRWHGSPRLTSIAPWVALSALGIGAVIAAVILTALPTYVVVLAPLAAGPAIGAFLITTRTAYLVTSNRIAVRSGVLGRQVTIVPIDRIQNSSLSQHALGRRGDYGTVTFDTASDGTSVRFRKIDDPQTVRRLVDRQLEDSSDRSLPGSAQEWEAVLEEVRSLRAVLESESA